MFQTHIDINGRRIGPGEPCYFIAEAGVSHFGDRGKALELVDLAAESGADVFKTQAFQTDELVSSRLPEWRERLRPKEVDFDFLALMKERCDERGIDFLCTAHTRTALDWVDELGVPAYKIGSGERGNLPFFAEHARRGKPVILSTGMYEQRHIEEALATFDQQGCEQLAVLHCVTSYPIPYEQVNLRAVASIAQLFAGPVGYSDHTDAHHAVLGAVALGATVVEKHITLDYDVPNAQDWKVSAGPDDLARLINSVRELEAALGTGDLSLQACEEPALEWALKSVVAETDLPSGHVLRRQDVAFRRPGDGVPPSGLNAMLGRSLRRPLMRDEPIRLEDLA